MVINSRCSLVSYPGRLFWIGGGYSTLGDIWPSNVAFSVIPRIAFLRWGGLIHQQGIYHHQMQFSVITRTPFVKWGSYYPAEWYITIRCSLVSYLGHLLWSGSLTTLLGIYHHQMQFSVISRTPSLRWGVLTPLHGIYHHQMQFNVITRTPFVKWGSYYSPGDISPSDAV